MLLLSYIWHYHEKYPNNYNLRKINTEIATIYQKLDPKHRIANCTNEACRLGLTPIWVVRHVDNLKVKPLKSWHALNHQ